MYFFIVCFMVNTHTPTPNKLISLYNQTKDQQTNTVTGNEVPEPFMALHSITFR